MTTGSSWLAAGIASIALGAAALAAAPGEEEREGAAELSLM